MTDQAIEQENQDKGLAGPRITPVDIEANIASEHYFTAYQGDAKAVEDAAFSGGALNAAASRATPDALRLLTFCVLMLRNGTKIVGINYGAIDPNQHSAEQGREEARAHAIEQIWPLMGYELRSKLYERAQFEAEPQVGYGDAQAPTDCPHADPLRYCAACVADPCPIGLGKGRN